MANVFEEPEAALATAAKLLDAEDLHEAAGLLRACQARFEQTGYDNWNGGTNIYTLYLRIPPEEYARLSSHRETIEKQIDERLEPVIRQFSEDWYSVIIVPQLEHNPGWRADHGGISRNTRQLIIDALCVEGIAWAGALDEIEFLERIFDLEELPSYDSRFKDAAGDIWQHRVNNPEDWDDDWIFKDNRFARGSHLPASRWSPRSAQHHDVHRSSNPMLSAT